MVGSKIYSFSVRDDKLLSAIEEFRKNGGNLSGLICNLLHHYFFSNNNNKEIITKEMMLLLEIKKRLDEFLQWREEVLPKLQELEEKLKQKQEQQELQDALPLIRELQLHVFDDIQDYANFEARCRRTGREPKDAIKARLSAWASEKQLSYPEAVNLFFKAFPQLKEKLEGRL
jgi:DNA-binding transcriptional MerR regulator